jgi:hypothetical protein
MNASRDDARQTHLCWDAMAFQWHSHGFSPVDDQKRDKIVDQCDAKPRID